LPTRASADRRNSNPEPDGKGDREALAPAVRNNDYTTSEHAVTLRPRERRSLQVKVKVHASGNLTKDQFFWVIDATS
jgi:hypothetical protein